MEQSYLSRLTFDPKLLKSPIASYLRNIRLTILLVISIIFLGIASFLTIPRRLNPEVNIPIITVTTVLPGATPEDVESLISIPLENSIRSLSGINTIQSVSRENVSSISIQFVSGTDRDFAKNQVQSQIDTVTLPSDARDPTVTALDFENVPIWQFALSSSVDVASLQMFAKSLKDKLEDDPKIDRVSITGLEEREIRIMLNQEKVQEFGFNPLGVSQAIRAGIASYPSGSVETKNNSFAFTIEPTIQSIHDIREIRLSIQGQVVRLGDVAYVSEQSKPQQSIVYIAKDKNSRLQAVTLSVFKTKTATITEASDRAKAIVDQEFRLYNNRFQIHTIVNTADEISKQFTDLLGEFRTTMLLVFGCLFLFLGLRQAIISSFTVPLTFLSAFAIMPYFDMSINFLTLFAFLLALGLLVDDTIVIISAMTAYYRTGKFTPQQTGLLVWRDTIVPIWSTTITTIWSFVPLLLASGIIGEFIKPIPIVVTITMISSTAIAVFITLPIMMIILKPDIPQRVIVVAKISSFFGIIAVLFAMFRENILFPIIIVLYIAWAFVVYRIWRTVLKISTKKARNVFIFDRLLSFLRQSSDRGVISIDGLAQWYRRIITSILSSKVSRRRVVIGIVAYALIGFLLVPTGLVKNEFFPKTNADRLYIELNLPQGTNLETTHTRMIDILDRVQGIPEAKFVIAELGRNAPNNFGGGSFQENNAALITLVIDEDRFSSIDLADRLRKSFSDTPSVSIVEVSGGPPAGADLQITVSGDDLSALSSYADQLIDYLNEKDGVVNPEKSIQQGTSALVFVPNNDSLAQAGVGIDAVGLWTRLHASGFSLGEVNFGTNQSDKRSVRFAYSDSIPTPESFGRIMIPTSRGYVPLLSLGSIELKANPTIITRENGKRTITVNADVRSGFSVTSLNKDLESYAQSLNLSEGYSWKTGGINEENAKSVQSILQAMGVATILILVTMVIQFRSFRQAMIVLLVIPLAVSSVFYVFGITGTPLSFPALIGVLSLFGIVVTNSMFIVDKINLNQKEGMSFEEAIADAGESRLEPIILTKLSTVLGLLPITIADPLWRGLGGAIISGLLIASTIMLLFIPVVYYQWMRPKK
ncbi:MAG: efflux RND transporter permease subunit [Patescibacteria group bacterium]|nr:efflux RND transporter permease subunit [Patescibacteria group bacterium]